MVESCHTGKLFLPDFSPIIPDQYEVISNGIDIVDGSGGDLVRVGLSRR